MIKQKYEIKKLQQTLRQNSISLKKFLILYCGVNPSSIHEIKLSHNDIKIIMPNLERVSFEYLTDNIKELYVGKIISVQDSYGIVIPYACPKVNEKSNPDITNNEKLETSNLNKIELSKDLKLYQLCLLRKKLKQYKRYKDYRDATKLIKSKVDYKVKQYKRNRNNLKEMVHSEY